MVLYFILVYYIICVPHDAAFAEALSQVFVSRLGGGPLDIIGPK